MGSTWSTRTGERCIQRPAGRWGWSTGCTPYEKSLVERANQYLKDRIEEFDDYYPCAKPGCKLEHVRNWLDLFVDMHYARRRHMTFSQIV